MALFTILAGIIVFFASYFVMTAMSMSAPQSGLVPVPVFISTAPLGGFALIITGLVMEFGYKILLPWG